MVRKYLKYPSLCFVLLFIVTMFLSGCTNTIQGLKQDWDLLRDWDKDFQKAAW